MQAGLLILLWVYEFGAQRRAYGKWQSEGERPGSWLTPVVAGVALVTFYVVVGAASAPLTARQVCERFAQACKDGDGAAMKTYADPYLHFAIDALTRLESDGRNSDFAVLAEGADQLGTFVNFRRSFRLAGEHHVLTGYFDLVPYQGSWRVKDLVYDRLGPDGKIQPYHVATGYTKLDEQERQGKLAPVPLPPSGTSARSGSTTGSASGASLFSDLGQKILVSVLSAIALAVGKYSWTLWRSAQSKAGGAPAS